VVRRKARQRAAWVGTIAPEMVAGASDNDPTNVGTAAVVGAHTGLRLSWVAVLVAPLLAVVQAIAAQLGLVAGDDLQSLTAKRYGRRVAAGLMASVVIVNVVTIAADLQAGAAGAGVLLRVDPRWIVLPLGVGLVVLLLIGRYEGLIAALKYLLIGFVAFVVAAILSHPNWSQLLRATFVPSLRFRREDIAGALALLGTTLTSYVYVWETVGRGVEQRTGADPVTGLKRARTGAVISAIFTAVIFWSMLVSSGATLGRLHHPVSSAQDAALALRPVVGHLAASLFAGGLLVSAVVALPVLIATTAYVVGAQFNWRRGLSLAFTQARRFYATLVASVLLAVAMALAQVSVFSLLVAASVIGGIATPAGIVFLVLLARDPAVMGERTISGRLGIAGGTVAAMIGAFALLYVVGAALGQF
jgi:Mn2+/Fe2+ NRAMP family transporter